MDYDKVLQELYSMPEWKFKLGLKNMKLLLKKLNHPERNLKCIHVAGTNGKGSVCAMISSVLKKGNYKVGMYTSPHLKKFNERIRINDKQISDKDIIKYYLRIKKHATNQSFFEITTSMMFLYFKEKKIDFAVIETGMGGRLDSTNVIKPLISIITNIAYEHEKFLGKSLKKIAYEKAGIIKKKVPIITCARNSALEVIKQTARARNAPLLVIDKVIKNRNLKLIGEYQQKNAAIASLAINILNNNQIKINKNKIEEGLNNTEWPGRFQLKNNILMDIAHNPAGFRILFSEIKKLKFNKLIAVLGFSSDKDVKTIAKIIKVDKLILTEAANERAAKLENIKRYFKNYTAIKNSKKALKYAKKIAKRDDLILIAGSIYLVGELV